MTVPDHVFDELPGLLAGELDRSTTGRVATHLRTCDDCRQELVLVMPAWAALQSADRFGLRAVLESEAALPDPSGLLAELAAERSVAGGQPGPAGDTGPAGAGTEAPASPGTRLSPEAGPGPDPWPVPEAHPGTGAWPGAEAGSGTDVRPGAETGTGEAARPGTPGERPTARPGRRQPGRHAGPHPRRRVWWSAVAAAVLLLAGFGAGVLISRDHTGSPKGPTIAMHAVAPWTATATATLRGDRLDIHPTNLGPPRPDHYYEVWLADRTGRTPGPLSVGILDPSGAGLTVPPFLASAFNTLVVSDEVNDGNAAFSGVSVMSGQYHQ